MWFFPFVYLFLLLSHFFCCCCAIICSCLTRERETKKRNPPRCFALKKWKRNSIRKIRLPDLSLSDFDQKKICPMASSVSTKTKVTGGSQSKSFLQTDNVFLYVPNIIGELNKEKKGTRFSSFQSFLLGYLRVLLSVISFYFMPTHPNITVVCYLTSGFLDALDGHAARALGQCKWRREMFSRYLEDFRYEIWCDVWHAGWSMFDDVFMLCFGDVLSQVGAVLPTLGSYWCRQSLVAFTCVKRSSSKKDWKRISWIV